MRRSLAARRFLPERGFTLVELLVSMAAGLMVAMAVVAMSREASNTFHEETRIAGAEMQIRTAMDRLRADVARAAFMSTGNIWVDPNIVTSPGTVTDVAGIPVTFNSNATNDMSLYSLAGIRLFSGGSAASTPLSAVNSLSPDAIEIAGNMTTVYEFPFGGATGTQAVVAGAGCNGAGQRVYLEVHSSPSLWLLVNLQLGAGDAGTVPTTAQYAAALNAVFQPVAGKQFIVRIVDSQGKTQYAATCATAAAGWNVVGTNQQPYVDLDPNTPVTISGTGGGSMTINPVQIVRWQIEPALVGYGGDAGDSTKYDLTRQYVDAMGARLGSAEVVAEYVADLKFAFTVDNTNLTTGNFPVGGSSSQVVLSLEDSATNATIGGIVTSQSITAPTNSLTPALQDLSGPQPQRIRSVRIRLSTRAETADRTEPLDAGLNYVYRYCTAGSAAACIAGSQVFARTRTEITEVAVPNQASLWYR